MSASQRVELHIAIHRPESGDFGHWALYLYNRGTGNHCTFQVVGEQNELTQNILTEEDPTTFTSFVKLILLGDIHESQINELNTIVASVPVRNDILTWDCQEYVLEIMDALKERDLLGSRPKYAAIERAVRNMRGSWDSTRRAVYRYDESILNGDVSNSQQPRWVDEDEEESATDDDANDDDEDGAEDEPTNIKSAEYIEDSDSEPEDEHEEKEISVRMEHKGR